MGDGLDQLAFDVSALGRSSGLHKRYHFGGIKCFALGLNVCHAPSDGLKHGQQRSRAEMDAQPRYEQEGYRLISDHAKRHVRDAWQI